MPIRRSLAFVAAFAACGATALAVDDWTLPRYNMQLNPVIADTAPPFAWTFAMGTGTSASPTISGDTLYVASNDHHVYALDLHTGKLRWSTLTNDMVMTAPLVYDGLVVAASGNEHPTVWDPPNYVAIGNSTNAIYGLDAQTGKQSWYFGINGTGMPSGAIVDGTYIHHDGGGTVLALDARTGTYRWRNSLGSYASMSAITPINPWMIATSGGSPNEVAVLRVRDGSTVWRHALPPSAGAVTDCPVASDGTRIYGVYIMPNDASVPAMQAGVAGAQHLYALDTQTGRMVWDTPVARGIAPPRNEASIPMVDAGTLYDGSAIAPKMTAVNAATGALRWQTTVHGPVKGGTVLKDGTLYFGDLAGYLWALDAASGKIVGALKTSESFNVGSPIIDGEDLIIGGLHGTVMAVPLQRIREGTDGAVN